MGLEPPAQTQLLVMASQRWTGALGLSAPMQLLTFPCFPLLSAILGAISAIKFLTGSPVLNLTRSVVKCIGRNILQPAIFCSLSEVRWI